MVPILVMLAVLAGPSPSPPPRAVPPRPDLTWAEADSLDQKLEAIEKRGRQAQGPGKILVTQGELNSYVNLTLGPRMPQGLSDVDIRLDPDRLRTTAVVDLDRVKSAVGAAGPLNPISYLGGRVPVELAARFPNRDGFGSLEFEEVRLGGFSLPVAVLQQMVAAGTRTPQNPQGFDILAPFRLPYSVKRVRLQAGKAMLEF